MLSFKSIAGVLGLSLGTLIVPASTVQAGCHLIDCVENVYVEPAQISQTSCETLWILRNSIYKDAKYCFKSERASAWFGNDGCQFDDPDAVSLNAYQRHNVELLQKAETDRGC